jgi:hypothetical protein
MRAACFQISRNASFALLKSKNAFPTKTTFSNFRASSVASLIQSPNLHLQRFAATTASTNEKGKQDIFTKYPAEASEEHFNLLLNGIKGGVLPRRSVLYR